MTISELARSVGMTPRNIRAYQSRGLLDPPVIRGRVAYYSGAHAARLQLIASLQREGFTLAAIKRLVETPGSYSAIVADRRRRIREGSTDISATVVVGVGRTLLRLGVPPEVVGTLQVDAARHGRRLGTAMREHLGRVAQGEQDIARVAVQLASTAFELGFLDAATAEDGTDGTDGIDGEPEAESA